MTSRRGDPYQVVRSPGFRRQWEEALASGRVPSGRNAALERVCSDVLARRPWIGASRPARPGNYRTVLIPRLTYRIPEIEIGYIIIEDDGIVSLEDVLNISGD